MVAVTDSDAALPLLEVPTHEAEAGRGLLLLSALVDELHVLPLPCGNRISVPLGSTAAAQHFPCPAA
ncbi:hypothetical protein AB0465_14550 [Streptomyces griseoviridis]|uniref:hypothetical protein n=1 Tax=Streptomyces griseoviridis TaxID=45398 RepID=UPI0033E63444